MGTWISPGLGLGLGNIGIGLSTTNDSSYPFRILGIRVDSTIDIHVSFKDITLSLNL
jgi:hypothetical protein